MANQTNNIVKSLPGLSLAELWVIIEAAQSEIRQQTSHPEALSEHELLGKIDRRYSEILAGKAKLIPGDVFDKELEKVDE